MRQIPRVLTIPPAAPFLPALAAGILDGKVVPGFAPRGKPELLASATIYLPTRRAARALAETLLDETRTSALLLPRIVPLGDVDEESFAFEAGDLDPPPPAIGIGERRLALAKLISGFAEKSALLPASPAIAVALADELAHLMDDFITAGLPFSTVEQAVKRELDKYWERSRDFLEIVGEHWGQHLKDRGKIDAAARRDLLLVREAQRLEKYQGGPIIAAGSTGTLPKVADLLRVIALHENGAIVLPGLDQILDNEAFARIGVEEEPMPGHPQFGLKRLIEKIGITREAVEELVPPENPVREEIFSLAFRPQIASDVSRVRTSAKEALKGIAIVEAADAREEALTIAIALREALHQNKSAALITPDRALARRVCAELSRWNIAIDDSAGLPLADSEAGRFARLLAEAASANALPSTLLALLRHPYLIERFPAENVALLEIAVLRGPRPAGGARNLSKALEAIQAGEFHRRDIRSTLTPENWLAAKATAQSLEALLTPLISIAQKEKPFFEIASAHRAAVLASLLEKAPENCETLVEALDALCDAGEAAPAMRLEEYADSFPALIREHTLRPPRDDAARIRILGPLEARLISADRIVLGGLCEGIWPPEAHTDSWLNRPMRKELKLDLPERRIGLSAHDFVQAASSEEVFLVRSRKQGGVETIASRFVQRLSAVTDESAWLEAKRAGERYLLLAKKLEAAERLPPLSPPEPKPPIEARPTQFSVSDVRDLVRDPYSIYAKHILRLAPLEAIDDEPGAAGRGTLLHEILSKFSQKFPASLPPNAIEELLAIGRQAFEPLREFPAAFAIWWPRFERIARWFVKEESTRRERISRILSEVGGRIKVEAAGKTHILTARADRIEENTDGTVSVLDYKTGDLPSYKEAILGFEPQLLLEAAIAKHGGFEKLARFERLSEIGPVKLSGGQPPGEFFPFELSSRADFKAVSDPRGISGPDHLDVAAEAALEGAIRLFAAYSQPATAYPFAPRVQWQKDYNDYEHLARFKEWSEDDSDER